MRRMRSEGGFSLVLVMVAIVVITLVGTTVVYTSGADVAAASARQTAALARQVAEAGLNHYGLLVQPSLVPTQIVVPGGGAGGAGGGGEAGFFYEDLLEGVAPFFEQDLPSAPPGYAASYAVWGGPAIDDGVQIILEGRLHPANDRERIIARSRISTVVVMTSGSDGYSGTMGWTPRNTGVLGGGWGEGYAGW